MQLIVYGAGILTAASLALAALVWLVLRIWRRRPPARFWRRALPILLALVPVHLLLVMPLVLGYMAAHFVGTRGDERGYDGPRIAADGSWLSQSRASLRAEADGAAVVDPAIARAARERAVLLESADGTELRAFFVPARQPEPRCSVVLVHGLFRGALELEPVGDMFRELGAEVLLLELRNHGGSGRASPTFGRDEAADVVAAVTWLRAREGGPRRPLVLFGVSLGTAAISLAVPEVRDLGGLVLDAPIEELWAAAHRLLTLGPRRGRRGFALWQPFRSLSLWAIELWCGFSFDEVRPAAALEALAPEVPVLVIGGGDDRRMPPDVVRRLFDGLPTLPSRKALWIRPGSDHGQVWTDDPAGYREHLASFLELVR